MTNVQNWPDPPGWDPTPCCGSRALLPVVYPLARLWLRVRVVLADSWCDGPPWPQG